MKVMLSQKNKITLCIIINVILLLVLYNIQVKDNTLLENLCLFKFILKKECWNCGMTRAFLSIIQCNFGDALKYNSKSIVVFPLTIIIYIYNWNKFIYKKNH